MQSFGKINPSLTAGTEQAVQRRGEWRESEGHLNVHALSEPFHAALHREAVRLPVPLEGELPHVPGTEQPLQHSHRLASGHIQSRVVGPKTLVHIVKTLQEEPPAGAAAMSVVREGGREGGRELTDSPRCC